jgi:hypothetical protein
LAFGRRVFSRSGDLQIAEYGGQFGGWKAAAPRKLVCELSLQPDAQTRIGSTATS